MQGPLPLRVWGGHHAPLLSIQNPLCRSLLQFSASCQAEKEGSSSKSQNLKGAVWGTKAIFKEILLAGISGITSRPERGHLGTGTSGRSPYTGRLPPWKASQPGCLWLSAQGSRSLPCFLPAELCANAALSWGRGINTGFCFSSPPCGPSGGLSFPIGHR